MLGTAGLCLLAFCHVSQCSARLSVTVKGRDHSYTAAGPQEKLIVNNMKKVLSLMAAMKASHTRLERLYELLRQDLRHGPPQDTLDQDYNKTLRPKYDVYKLNRIYTPDSHEWQLRGTTATLTPPLPR